jgi:hypothetical protein
VNADEVLREQLLSLLRGGHAHMTFDQAVADFPAEHINHKLPEAPYTAWHLLEHIRIAQWDILEFIRNPEHVSPPWPAGHWPAPGEEADAARWAQTLADFHADLEALQAIVENPDTDLTAPLPHAEEYTVLREILSVVDHNAYHIGELAMLRHIMDTWPAERQTP